MAYSITNRGTVSLSGLWQWADTCYVSTNALLDGRTFAVDSFYEAQSLPAQSVYRRTNLVTLPQLPAEQYYLIIKADGQSQIGELDEANNTFAIPLTDNLADLVATDLAAPGDGVGGTAVTITYALTNRGRLRIDADWMDSAYLSVNPTWESSDARLADFSTASALGLGDGRTFTNTCTLPTWPPGSYHLILYADSYDRLVESDDVTNNVLVRPINLSVPVVPSGADLVPTDVSLGTLNEVTRSWSVVTVVSNRGPGAAYSASGSWEDRGIYPPAACGTAPITC